MAEDIEVEEEGVEGLCWNSPPARGEDGGQWKDGEGGSGGVVERRTWRWRLWAGETNYS